MSVFTNGLVMVGTVAAPSIEVKVNNTELQGMPINLCLFAFSDCIVLVGTVAPHSIQVNNNFPGLRSRSACFCGVALSVLYYIVSCNRPSRS